ncbi:MAG: Hsp33 family molecular chaperone HslO, partial [Shewanella sp.]|nr:Hsp33 family molecular chaperone HslO [Shewanella sp.]
KQVRLFDPIPVSFKCTCSRERSAAAIRTLDKTEVDAILAEEGKVEMDCEYCNSKYVFDSIDIEGIFANQAAPAARQ